MLKKTLTVLFILNFLNIYSQVKISGEIIYEVSLNKDKFIDKFKEDNETSRQVKILVDNASNTKYSLKFSNNESTYEYINVMENDAKKGINITKIFAGNDNTYYYNSSSKESIDKTTVENQTFLINRLVIQWKLLKESKKIGDYICYKAIALNEDGSSSEIVAWYTQEIPVQFGPYRFNNLPGLVIELHDSNVIFYAKKILINKTPITVTKPNIGTEITYEEFKQKFNGFFKE